ncbi:menin [Bombyx mori]|uniref:Menin n=1 Tax=Bombyx mori TaxID=7091 RepID=A0A8R1WM55_BOMMO|nr:menin [Bombyx mori]
MSGINDYKHFFPIDGIQKVCDLFEKQLRSDKEADLALFSIIVGAVENNLTNIKIGDKDVNLHSNNFVKMKFPCIEWDEVRSLHERFVNLMRTGVDAKLLSGAYATRDLVKKVADVVWNSLTRSYYKDRAHLQSIYSFLTGNKLDCFGVAFAVTAGCQVLGKQDVHLALSEDHAWVVFGQDGKETAEVTWHGKGNEDKRGRSVGDGVSARSWLYVAGKPVVCTRVMELAALVSSINTTLTQTVDVHEVAQMQHKLLWLLYDSGYLDAYPMALGNLADLDDYMKVPNITKENNTTSSTDDISNVQMDNTQRPDVAGLYAQAIKSAKTYYDDRHVYPYTLQGGYYHRQKMYKEAFHAWASAGDVIRHYNYSRDDEEIYKEFAEIANELIPQLMKAESSGHSARSILKDPECFASLLRFYDGICKWEEGSQTPILHIGWAKPLVSTISKFDAEVRAQVYIVCRPDSGEVLEHQEPDGEKKETTENGNELKSNNSENAEMTVREQLTAAVNSRPRVTLYSHKMAALKPLLLAERLNTHALQLQLTAQSQLQRPQVPTKRRDDEDQNACFPTARAKRARRER